VEIGKSSRREIVWRRPGERYSKDCLRPTFKSGRKSVMVWGCFAGDRLGPLVICEDGRMNATKYIQVLDSHLKPFLKELEMEWGEGIIFQEDRCAIHTAKKSVSWKEENGIVALDWPAQSPDLNPIENLWKILKDRIQSREKFPRDTKELKVALQEEWSKIDSSLLFNLVESMERRVKEVLKQKGLPSKY
jgi:hypothetical protein